MNGKSVRDHKWHDISYYDLPEWVRRRASELPHRQVVGRSFTYRRDPRTGRYQRKLRYHLPWGVRQVLRAGRWLKRNPWKLLLFSAGVGVTAIVLSTVGQAVSGAVSIVAGIIICLLGLGVLLACLRTLTRRRPRFVGMAMALLVSLIFIVVSSAYLDIRSPRDVRDSMVSVFTTEQGQFRSAVESLAKEVGLTFAEVTEDEQAVSTPEPGDGEVQNGDGEHVFIGGAVLVGADGHWIVLHNNPSAVDPTWEQLKQFLATDNTDEQTYRYGSFVCADFAEMLHNNAEAAGIRAAYVVIDLAGGGAWGHALNAFDTVDDGTVYVDATGLFEWDTYPCSCDTLVDVQVGSEYVPESIFPCPGWSSTWSSLGRVTELYVEW